MTARHVPVTHELQQSKTMVQLWRLSIPPPCFGVREKMSHLHCLSTLSASSWKKKSDVDIGRSGRKRRTNFSMSFCAPKAYSGKNLEYLLSKMARVQQLHVLQFWTVCHRICHLGSGSGPPHRGLSISWLPGQLCRITSTVFHWRPRLAHTEQEVLMGSQTSHGKRNFTAPEPRAWLHLTIKPCLYFTGYGPMRK